MCKDNRFATLYYLKEEKNTLLLSFPRSEVYLHIDIDKNIIQPFNSNWGNESGPNSVREGVFSNFKAKLVIVTGA